MTTLNDLTPEGSKLPKSGYTNLRSREELKKFNDLLDAQQNAVTKHAMTLLGREINDTDHLMWDSGGLYMLNGIPCRGMTPVEYQSQLASKGLVECPQCKLQVMPNLEHTCRGGLKCTVTSTGSYVYGHSPAPPPEEQDNKGMPISVYTRLALRTKAPPSLNVVRGLLAKITWIRNSLAIVRDDRILNTMDSVKKEIFYIKPDAESPPVLDNLGRLIAEKSNLDTPVIRAYTDLMHGVIGLLTEIPELLLPIEHISLSLENTCRGIPFDDPLPSVVNAWEECGDMLWYINLIVGSLATLSNSNVELCAVAESNIAKLYQRHGEKFSAEGAATRDVLNELKTLRQHFGLEPTVSAVTADTEVISNVNPDGDGNPFQ